MNADSAAVAALGDALDGAIGWPIGPMRNAPRHYAGHVLERLREHPEGAAVLVRALERPDPDRNRTAPDPVADPDDDDRPPVLVAPDTAAPSPPCPDVETWRAHQNFHRQQPDGTWTCAACAILAPSRLATSARP